jgi:hypothetical protein
MYNSKSIDPIITDGEWEKLDESIHHKIYCNGKYRPGAAYRQYLTLGGKVIPSSCTEIIDLQVENAKLKREIESWKSLNEEKNRIIGEMRDERDKAIAENERLKCNIETPIGEGWSVITKNPNCSRQFAKMDNLIQELYERIGKVEVQHV